MHDKDKLLARFQELDTDSDGMLSLEEMRAAFQKYAEAYPELDNFSDEEIEIFLSVADDNGDGVISYEEFVNNLEL